MTDSHDSGGFLSRWSQRKAQVKQGDMPPREASVKTPVSAPVSTPPVAPSAAPLPLGPEVAPSRAEEVPPLPTLAEVAQLTRESDFSRFVAPGVDASVKNAAMKKLFTDPHFNVMDGLDIYIDDYNKFEPIPKSMLRQMVQARALGLLDDELEEQDKPAPDNPPIHEDTDLQLQPDDAAGQPGADESLAGPVAVDHAGEPDVGDGIEPDELSHNPVPPRSA